MTTLAVRLPAFGRVENDTVSAVVVAFVTVPMAPLLKVNTLLAAVVLKPKPLMVNVDSSPPRMVVVLLITPIILATCTAEPLTTEFVVTVAVRLPTVVGLVLNVTVSRVAVALVTVPMAPLLNATTFREAIGSKPTPLISRVDALIPTFAVLVVTKGTTDAIWTAVPLEIEFVVTWAVKLLAAGFLPSAKVTVSDVGVAAVTVPSAPLLKTTVLFASVVSNPKPAMVTEVASAFLLAVLLVMIGLTVAT